MTETSPPYGDQPEEPPDPRYGFAYCGFCDVRFEVLTRMEMIEHLCPSREDASGEVPVASRVSLPVCWPEDTQH